MTIAAAMIVRDEEAHLGRCLASLRPMCDEIVVVDTGSRDRTIEIARQFGAQVHEHPWTNNFAAARNSALSYVEADWAFTIDADEEVTETDMASVRSGLADPAVLVGLVRQCPRPGWTDCDELRFSRTGRGLRFERAVHEHLTGFDPNVPEVIARVPVHLHHHGYDTDAELVRKATRDLPIIATELQRRPDDHFLRAARGKCLARLGRYDDAITAWSDGVAAGDRLCTILLAQHQLGRGDSSDAAVHKARERWPDDIDLRWIAAEHARLDRDHHRVIGLLEPLLDLELSDVRIGSRPTHVLGAWAHELIGRSQLALGRPGDAAESFRGAIKTDPDTVRHQAMLTLAENLVPR